MTDPRIDLRSLYPSDEAQADRVVQAAVARIAGLPRPEDVPSLWLDVQRTWRPAVLAAAVVIIAALGTIVGVGRDAVDASRATVPRAGTPPVAELLEWVERQRAPSGAELLEVFSGYGP